MYAMLYFRFYRHENSKANSFECRKTTSELAIENEKARKHNKLLLFHHFLFSQFYLHFMVQVQNMKWRQPVTIVRP
jgi:hypothetical protein